VRCSVLSFLRTQEARKNLVREQSAARRQSHVIVLQLKQANLHQFADHRCMIFDFGLTKFTAKLCESYAAIQSQP